MSIVCVCSEQVAKMNPIVAGAKTGGFHSLGGWSVQPGKKWPNQQECSVSLSIWKEI
jgi:hypothetical protein